MNRSRSFVWNWMHFLLLALLPLLAAAEEPKPELVPMMRELAPGVYELGKMHLDKNTGTLTVPGFVNQIDGAIEYLICTPQGSTHESLLVADVQPNDIHFGMLLLGAKGAGILAPAATDAPPAQLDAEYLKHAPALKGDRLTITAQWKDAAGKALSAPVEDWVLNTKTNKAATRGPWIYTGSMFLEKIFLAQQQGAIACVITNPAALINNPRPGNDNDQIWVVNEKKVPPVKTALEISFKLEPATP